MMSCRSEKGNNGIDFGPGGIDSGKQFSGGETEKGTITLAKARPGEELAALASWYQKSIQA